MKERHTWKRGSGKTGSWFYIGQCCIKRPHLVWPYWRDLLLDSIYVVVSLFYLTDTATTTTHYFTVPETDWPRTDIIYTSLISLLFFLKSTEPKTPQKQFLWTAVPWNFLSVHNHKRLSLSHILVGTQRQQHFSPIEILSGFTAQGKAFPEAITSTSVQFNSMSGSRGSLCTKASLPHDWHLGLTSMDR